MPGGPVLRSFTNLDDDGAGGKGNLASAINIGVTMVAQQHAAAYIPVAPNGKLCQSAKRRQVSTIGGSKSHPHRCRLPGSGIVDTDVNGMQIGAHWYSAPT